jgi:hypothetical protein
MFNRVAILATHRALEEVARVIQLAAKDIHEVINATPTLGR